jgi:Trypsin-like peptidase domain
MAATRSGPSLPALAEPVSAPDRQEGFAIFADAVALATRFTYPVVVSYRRWNGAIEAGVAAFVVLNRDGWIVTAAHIFEPGLQVEKDGPKVAALKDQIAAVRADATLRPGFAAREVKRIEATADRTWITNHSYWWSTDGITVRDVTLLTTADIAVARLGSVPANMVAVTPTIKNPAVNMEPGRSLCRLGFPFAMAKTTYDEASDSFNLDARISFFPNDGIFTRTITTTQHTPAGAAIQFVETSTPGLKGQSGGPLFDVNGRVWGIQSSTTTIPLGFNPEIDVGGRKITEHQFISLGRAVHPSTLCAVLNELGVSFEMSAD